MTKILARIAATTGAVVTVGLMLPAAPATAVPTVTPKWFGAVHVTVNTSTQYGGWVDGNGPDSYMAWADCNNGSLATGVERWAGDRRKSIATCSSGIKPGSFHRGILLNEN